MRVKIWDLSSLAVQLHNLLLYGRSLLFFWEHGFIIYNESGLHQYSEEECTA
jgi:hypothetical protein